MPTIITTAAQKGGVAKTTTVHALASFLSLEHKTLVIDADPQLTLTSAVAGEHELTLHDVLVPKRALLDAVVPALPSYGGGLAIVPGSPLMAGLDAATASDLNRQYLLADALADVHGIDFVLMDCPAGQGLAVTAALVAADVVITPAATSPAAFETLETFEQTIRLIQRRLNPRLEWLIVPSIVAAHQVLDRDVLAAIENRYGDRLMKPVIPRRVSIAERMAAQLPANHPSFQELTKTLLERIKS